MPVEIPTDDRLVLIWKLDLFLLSYIKGAW